MTISGSVFATITATLEDMHAIAVEGQHPDLGNDEGMVLTVLLREGVGRLHGLIDQAAAVMPSTSA